MTPAVADALIKEWEQLGKDIQALRKRRGEIAKKFPNGRTEGYDLAIYKAGGGWHDVVSIRKLRQYVTQTVLDRCRERRFKNGSLRIVKKKVAKP